MPRSGEILRCFDPVMIFVWGKHQQLARSRIFSLEFDPFFDELLSLYAFSPTLMIDGSFLTHSDTLPGLSLDRTFFIAGEVFAACKSSFPSATHLCRLVVVSLVHFLFCFHKLSVQKYRRQALQGTKYYNL